MGTPSAPQNVVVVPTVEGGTVSWDPPDDDGGEEITTYQWTAEPGSLIGDTLGPAAMIFAEGSLTGGVTYTFTLWAVNVDGNGETVEFTLTPLEAAPTVDTAEPRARTLKDLLPPGPLWLLEQGSKISKTLLGAAVELARLEARGQDLIEESDPRTATETLSEWEQALSLPDERVTEIPATTAGRRVAVTQKYTDRGGQNEEFFQALALVCGYTVTLSLFHTLMPRCGVARAGVWTLHGVASAYAMQVNVSAVAGNALASADFERIMRHAAHAHITLIFDYP